MNKMVKCHDNRCANLTVGKEYYIKGESEDCYIVSSDDGLIGEYLKTRFMTEEEKIEVAEYKQSLATSVTTPTDKPIDLLQNYTDGVIKTMTKEAFALLNQEYIKMVFAHVWDINYGDAIVKFEIANGQVIAKEVSSGRIYGFGELNSMKIDFIDSEGVTIEGNRSLDPDRDICWYLKICE